MAKNTMELTIHVDPNSSARCTTLLVSINMNPAPMKNMRQFGVRRLAGANANSTPTAHAAMTTMPRTFTAGTAGLSRYRNGQSSVGR